MHLHLAADPHWQAREHVQRVGDPSIGRIFHGHQAEVGMLPVDLFEDGRDGPHRDEFDRAAEAMQGGQVAITVNRPQERDPQRSHQRAATAQKFAEDGPHGGLGERAGGFFHDFRKGQVVKAGGAGRSDIGRSGGLQQFGALLDEGGDLAIDIRNCGGTGLGNGTRRPGRLLFLARGCFGHGRAGVVWWKPCILAEREGSVNGVHRMGWFRRELLPRFRILGRIFHGQGVRS